MLPSSPAAYSRTEYEPFGGGGPGLYVDFSMFCFQVPMIGFVVLGGPWAGSRLDHPISITPIIKLRLIGDLLLKQHAGRQSQTASGGFAPLIRSNHAETS